MADETDEGLPDNSKIKALPGGASKLKLTPISEMRLNTSRCDLVKGILPQTGLVVVWGPPKCGKSFWVMDMLLHACQGWTYRGRKTQAGGVLYCAFEGQGGIPARVEALRQRFFPKNTDIPFYICRDVIDIIKDYKSLIVSVRQLPGQRVNAVVLDTLNKSLFGSENKDEDMSAYIRAADAIAETLACVVVVIHHCGTAGTRPRGHTALTGAVDMQIKVTRKARTVTAEVELAKDDTTGDTIVSLLEDVIVGKDNEGNPIKTAVIVPADGKTDRDTRVERLPPKARGAYLRLRELVREGEKFPVEEFREALARVKLVNEKGNPREQVKRLLETLQTADLVNVQGEFVLLTPT